MYSSFQERMLLTVEAVTRAGHQSALFTLCQASAEKFRIQTAGILMKLLAVLMQSYWNSVPCCETENNNVILRRPNVGDIGTDRFPFAADRRCSQHEMFSNFRFLRTRRATARKTDTREH